MKDSILLQVFQQFSAWEIYALGNFVQSPVFNQREDVVLLFQYLVNTHKEGGGNLEKKMVYQVVYPDKDYDDDQMRLVMHFLLKLFKTFIAYRESEGDEQQQQLYLCQGLRKRALDKVFQKEVQKLKKKQEKLPRRNARYHHLNYELAQESHAFKHQQQRTGEGNLNELTEQLTAYYLAEMYRHACTQLSQQNISTKSYDLELVRGLAQVPAYERFFELPAVAVYRFAFLMLSDPEAGEQFYQLKALLKDYRGHFSSEEIRDLYLLAINFCIRRLNQGEKLFIREAFDLYRLGLENEALLEEKRLSKFTYNNALLLALGLEEWDWAIQFLQQYRALLPPSEAENIYDYNLSIYHFRRREYYLAMDLLRAVTFEDVQYDLNARCMLLRIYYELQELDALESLLDSFRNFMRRRKDLGYHKENYLNLITFVRQLLRIQPGDEEALVALRQKVEVTKGVAEKKWLLEVLEAAK